MEDVARNVTLIKKVLVTQVQRDGSYKPLAVSFFTDAIIEAYGKDCDAWAFLGFYRPCL